MRRTIMLLLGIIFYSTFSEAQEKLQIDLNQSTIKWIGEYTFYFGGHEGFVNFKEGYLTKEGDVLTGGEFIIDMNSITNTDIDHEKSKTDLVNHLKQSDFFDVKKHPLSKLVITNINYSDKTHARIEAKLTLKGVTETINFRAEFDYARKEMKTRFKINRRTWNVNYKSKFKDGAISDGIGFEVLIKL